MIGGRANGDYSGVRSEKCIFVDGEKLQCSYQALTMPDPLVGENGGEVLLQVFPVFTGEYCSL